MRIAHLVATFGGVGNLPSAPGTYGSLAALPAAWLLYVIGGPILILIAIVAAFAAGMWATQAEREATGAEDPQHVVIDEVVGQWIALLPVVIGAAHAGVPVLALWPGWIVAFAAFRLFDIRKPGPVGWADRRGDTMGVMLDDVFAGIIAAVVVVVLGGAYHALFI